MIDWEVGKILAGKLEETFEQKNQGADWKTGEKEMRVQKHFPKLGDHQMPHLIPPFYALDVFTVVPFKFLTS